MSRGRVACLGCGRDLPPEFENAPDFLGCPSCLEQVRVFTFPALHRAGTGSAGLPVIEDGEVSCYYHPQKKAVLACDNCGRFLCPLCDIEIGAEHRCPACLEAGKRKQKIASVENRRILYDGLALTLATVPILIWPITLFTAPTSLFIVVRHWRGPLSILPRTRIRFVLAFIIALAEICGWVTLIYFLVAKARRAG